MFNPIRSTVSVMMVLERSPLRRLTAERDLTGIGLRLCGSTRLLEMGVRRTDDGQGMVVTCRTLSLGGGVPKKVCVVVASRETVHHYPHFRSHEVATVVSPRRKPYGLDDRRAVRREAETVMGITP